MLKAHYGNNWPHAEMQTSFVGCPVSVATAFIFANVSKLASPSKAPTITCLLSNHDVYIYINIFIY